MFRYYLAIDGGFVHIHLYPARVHGVLWSSLQSILFPNTEDPLKIAKSVFFRSYFQLYGELFFDEMDSKLPI